MCYVLIVQFCLFGLNDRCDASRHFKHSSDRKHGWFACVCLYILYDLHKSCMMQFHLYYILFLLQNSLSVCLPACLTLFNIFCSSSSLFFSAHIFRYRSAIVCLIVKSCLCVMYRKHFYFKWWLNKGDVISSDFILIFNKTTRQEYTKEKKIVCIKKVNEEIKNMKY